MMNFYVSVNAFKNYLLTDRQTDTTKIIYHTTLLVVNNVVLCVCRTLGWSLTLWHQTMMIAVLSTS